MNTGHPIACGDDCPQCAAPRPDISGWLDRKPPDWTTGAMRGWTEWFDWRRFDGHDVTYLGERSARTGPDVVPAVQRCECPQCRGELGGK